MMIGILKEWLVKYFFVHKIVFKAILVLKVVIFKHSVILFRCSMIWQMARTMKF
jgi:hypothetical protein